MKLFSNLLMTLGVSAALLSVSAYPAQVTEKKEQPQAVISDSSNQTKSTPQQNASRQMRPNSTAIQVIAPQDDLEVAIRNSEQGDILLLGPEGWYRIEAKSLAKGTKMFVLSTPGSKVSAFPKEDEKSQTR